MAIQYEVCYVNSDGKITKGGIPTTKSHAQRWANQNNKLDPENQYTICEYDGRNLEEE